MKCEKCGHESEANRKKHKTSLCTICYNFSPDDEKSLRNYVNEKIDGSVLNSFRKQSVSSGEKQKQGMMKKAIKGNLMSRAPFGYTIQNKKLVPAENHREVEEIFEEFIHGKTSLRKLAEKHKLSVNGLKKVLTNFTYIGKIKFSNQIYEGEHKPIISPILFNEV
jgi:site-specific DNA recombinase